MKTTVRARRAKIAALNAVTRPDGWDWWDWAALEAARRVRTMVREGYSVDTTPLSDGSARPVLREAQWLRYRGYTGKTAPPPPVRGWDRLERATAQAEFFFTDAAGPRSIGGWDRLERDCAEHTSSIAGTP